MVTWFGPALAPPCAARSPRGSSPCGAPLLLRLVALVLPGADAQPTGEVLLRREAADIDADLGKDDQGRAHVDAVDLRQIHPQRLEQRLAGVEVQVVGLAPAASRLCREGLVGGAVRELGQLRLDHLVA